MVVGFADNRSSDQENRYEHRTHKQCSRLIAVRFGALCPTLEVVRAIKNAHVVAIEVRCRELFLLARYGSDHGTEIAS